MPFPWVMLGQAAVGGVQSWLGSSARDKANAKAREANRLQFEYAKDARRRANRAGRKKVEFMQEGVDIQRDNQAKNIALRQLQEDENRNYAMQIRQLKFENQKELAEESALFAAKQVGFNQRGYNQAVEEQNNYKLDQQINFELDRIGLDLKNRQGVQQYNLDQASANLQQRSVRAKNSFAMQGEQLKGLKSLGLAKAKGQSGRTAGKNVQAAIAESGFQQARIAEETSLSGEQYKLNSQNNAQKLNDLSAQLIMQRQEIDFSEDSFERSDDLQRRKLKMQLEQANAEAMSRIMKDPKMAPMLPEVPRFIEYAAEFQDPMPWDELPEPIKGMPQQDYGTLLGDLLGNKNIQGALGSAASEIGNSLFDKPNTGLNTDMTIGGLPSLEDAFSNTGSFNIPSNWWQS